MGDITTHKEIVLHMIPQLTQISAAENYTYVEFGNFLTDVSQFRDPVAYIGAKRLLRIGGLVGPLSAPVLCGELDGFLGSGNLDKWLNDMFGSASETKRHGALPTFFQHMSRAVAHMRFSETSDQREPGLTPLSAAEVDRVFAAAFTQYFPHEHVDYPPLINIRNPNRMAAYRPGTRKIIKYLELHIGYISEELSRIEFEWMQNRTLAASHPTRVDLLVRLGHVLHAVEDFFFHSNVVELRQWNRVVAANPDRHPETVPADYQFLVDNILTGTGLDETKVRLRRRLARRLRYPVFDDEVAPPPLTGTRQVATELKLNSAYTGGFGSTDVAHTIASALDGFEESFQANKPLVLTLLQNSQIPLVQALFSAQERQLIAGACTELNTRVATHKQQVTSGDYAPLLDLLQTRKVLTAEGKAAFVDAFELDKTIMTRYPGKPGPGAFLLVWLRRIQKESEGSHAAADALDADAQSPYDLYVDNTSSEETVGTHSLMAKDGDAKEPLRKHAMALAKCASTALAVILVQRITSGQPADGGIDWEPVLRHFMRIPPGTAGKWEEQVLTALAAGSDIPALADLQEQPPVTMLSSQAMASRRTGQSRSLGESLYRKFESVVDR